MLFRSVEHSAVLQCVKRLEQEGCAVTYVRPDSAGRVTAGQADKILVAVCQYLCGADKKLPVGEDARPRMGTAHFGSRAVGGRHPVGTDQPVDERADTDRTAAGLAVGDRHPGLNTSPGRTSSWRRGFTTFRYM